MTSRLAVIAALTSLAACAGPDPGPGDMELAGTLLPPELLECQSDRDGRITSEELPLLAGITAHQRLHRDVDFSTAGSGASGALTWQVPEGGEIVNVSTEPIADAWFADAFEPLEPSYAVAVDPAVPQDDQILGVYRVEPDRVLLLGLASRHPDRPAGGMLLPYDTPATVLRFPVELGDGWEQVVQVTEGTVGGAAFSSEDTYRIEVDARGTVETEDAIIRDALRLSVSVTVRTPALDPVEQLEHIWYRECVGEVARAAAPPGTTGPEFDHAEQLRVLAF